MLCDWTAQSFKGKLLSLSDWGLRYALLWLTCDIGLGVCGTKSQSIESSVANGLFDKISFFNSATVCLDGPAAVRPLAVVRTPARQIPPIIT